MMTPMGVMSLPKGIAEVFFALHTMPLLQHLTPLAHKRQAGVPKEGLRRR
jgi:hypothetical protein